MEAKDANSLACCCHFFSFAAAISISSSSSDGTASAGSARTHHEVAKANPANTTVSPGTNTTSSSSSSSSSNAGQSSSDGSLNVTSLNATGTAASAPQGKKKEEEKVPTKKAGSSSSSAMEVDGQEAAAAPPSVKEDVAESAPPTRQASRVPSAGAAAATINKKAPTRTPSLAALAPPPPADAVATSARGNTESDGCSARSGSAAITKSKSSAAAPAPAPVAAAPPSSAAPAAAPATATMTAAARKASQALQQQEDKARLQQLQQAIEACSASIDDLALVESELMGNNSSYSNSNNKQSSLHTPAALISLNKPLSSCLETVHSLNLALLEVHHPLRQLGVGSSAANADSSEHGKAYDSKHKLVAALPQEQLLLPLLDGLRRLMEGVIGDGMPYGVAAGTSTTALATVNITNPNILPPHAVMLMPQPGSVVSAAASSSTASSSNAAAASQSFSEASKKRVSVALEACLCSLLLLTSSGVSTFLLREELLAAIARLLQYCVCFLILPAGTNANNTTDNEHSLVWRQILQAYHQSGLAGSIAVTTPAAGGKAVATAAATAKSSRGASSKAKPAKEAEEEEEELDLEGLEMEQDDDDDDEDDDAAGDSDDDDDYGGAKKRGAGAKKGKKASAAGGRGRKKKADDDDDDGEGNSRGRIPTVPTKLQLQQAQKAVPQFARLASECLLYCGELLSSLGSENVLRSLGFTALQAATKTSAAGGVNSGSSSAVGSTSSSGAAGGRGRKSKAPATATRGGILVAQDSQSSIEGAHASLQAAATSFLFSLFEEKGKAPSSSSSFGGRFNSASSSSSSYRQEIIASLAEIHCKAAGSSIKKGGKKIAGYNRAFVVPVTVPRPQLQLSNQQQSVKEEGPSSSSTNAAAMGDDGASGASAGAALAAEQAAPSSSPAAGLASASAAPSVSGDVVLTFIPRIHCCTALICGLLQASATAPVPVLSAATGESSVMDTTSSSSSSSDDDESDDEEEEWATKGGKKGSTAAKGGKRGRKSNASAESDTKSSKKTPAASAKKQTAAAAAPTTPSAAPASATASNPFLTVQSLAHFYTRCIASWVVRQLNPQTVTAPTAADEALDARNTFRMIAVDLLAVFDLPEWPAAETLLSSLANALAKLSGPADRTGNGSGNNNNGIDAATLARVTPSALGVLGTILSRVAITRGFIQENSLKIALSIKQQQVGGGGFSSSSAAAPSRFDSFLATGGLMPLPPSPGNTAGGTLVSRSPSTGVSPLAVLRGRNSSSRPGGSAAGGSSPSQSQLSSDAPASALQPKTECTCGRGVLQGVSMVACDVCEQWFHGSCVGLDLDNAESSDEFDTKFWACDDCQMARLIEGQRQKLEALTARLQQQQQLQQQKASVVAKEPAGKGKAGKGGKKTAGSDAASKTGSEAPEPSPSVTALTPATSSAAAAAAAGVPLEETSESKGKSACLSYLAGAPRLLPKPRPPSLAFHAISSRFHSIPIAVLRQLLLNYLTAESHDDLNARFARRYLLCRWASERSVVNDAVGRDYYASQWALADRSVVAKEATFAPFNTARLTMQVSLMVLLRLDFRRVSGASGRGPRCLVEAGYKLLISLICPQNPSLDSSVVERLSCRPQSSRHTGCKQKVPSAILGRGILFCPPFYFLFLLYFAASDLLPSYDVLPWSLASCFIIWQGRRGQDPLCSPPFPWGHHCCFPLTNC
jgi:PHD-finger